MHHEVGQDTFLATKVSEEGPYVEIFDLSVQVFDGDGPLTDCAPIEYEGRNGTCQLQFTVEQARALAAAINKAADDAEAARPRLATYAEGVAFAEQFGFTDPEEG